MNQNMKSKRVLNKKTSKQTQSKPFKHVFIQDWGTYSDQMIVSVGMSTEDLLSWVKKLKDLKEGVVEILEENLKTMENRRDKGGFMRFTTEKCAVSCLIILEWDRTLENNGLLVHELSHAIDFVLGNGKMMERETEAKAYQLEFLYLAIVRELDRKWYSKGEHGRLVK